MATFSGTFALQLKLEERKPDQSVLYLFISPAGMTSDGRIMRAMNGVSVKNVDQTTQHPILVGYRKQLEDEWPNRTSWSTHIESPLLWQITGTCNSLDRFGNPGDIAIVETLSPIP